MMRSALHSSAVAAMEKAAIKNMTAPIPFEHITNDSTFNQEIHEANVKLSNQ
jgi:glucan phosphorylase